MKKAKRKSAPRSLAGWRTDFENMPPNGKFQALQIKPEVFQHGDGRVIDPMTGRLFTPYAWKPKRR